MVEEKDILERIASVEVQVKDIQEVKLKLDSLYNLMMDMKLENANTKSGFATKLECAACKKDLEHRLDTIEEGKRKLFWMSLASGVTFVLWLIEQMLHVTLKIGG